MTKIRAQTLVAGLTGKADPMNKIGAKGFYIRSAGGMWWSKKRVILANLPHTIENPTPAQMAVRVGFGRAARATKGMPLGKRLEIMRKDAPTAIRNTMREYAAEKLSEAELRERRKGYHTLEQLEAMLARKREKERVSEEEVAYRFARFTEAGL